jgi:fibronectin type 3 domain-containing protein
MLHDLLRSELLSLRDGDLALREELLAAGELGGAYHPRMEAMHVKNARRLRQLIADHGWPAADLAGADGAEAAWLIAQHSIGEPEFMRIALRLIKECVEQGRAPAWHAAHLEDRIALYEGRPQRFGTQTIDDPHDGLPRPWTLAEPDRVNELRALLASNLFPQFLRPAATSLPKSAASTKRTRNGGSTGSPPAAGADTDIRQPAVVAAPPPTHSKPGSRGERPQFHFCPSGQVAPPFPLRIISLPTRRAAAQPQSGGHAMNVLGPSKPALAHIGAAALAFLLVGCASGTLNGGSGGGSGKPGSTAQPPSTPLGLQATAGNAQVTLAWAPSSGASTYALGRSTTSGGPYAQIATPSSTGYLDTGLSNGTAYYYVVAAVNSGGTSPNSAQVTATPTAPVILPSAPTSLAATAGNSQITLTWTGSSGANSYNVKRSSTNGGPYTKVASPTATTFTDTGLTNGTPYFYVVTAVSSAGESAPSNQATAAPAAPLAPPPVPTGLRATPGNAQISLSWNSSTAATSYHLKRSTTTGGPYTPVSSPTVPTFIDTGLTNGTPYFYVVSALDSAGESANSSQASAIPVATPPPDVTITIDPAKTKPISPYIYGLNFYFGNSGAPPHLTFDRAGGNRWTAYNWETNASNAGSDYLYENDNYLSSSNVAGEAVRSFIAQDQGQGLASLLTVQLQGLVAGDENGPVSTANPPDMTRFKTVVDKKSAVSSSPFTTMPINYDAYVFMDEFLWALDQKFSGMGIFGATPTHPAFVELDNEPELWNSTHLEVEGPNPVTSDNYISKTIALAEALKDQFPNAVIFGPVHYGFEGIYNWQGELSATPAGANWFPDKYLPALESAATTYGRRLVDVYDFHWYSEATDGSGNRVINLTGPSLSDAQVQAIVQSPRSLWDTTFTENSWITTDVLGGAIYILGRLQAKIASENPGMKIAITEYNNGGGEHIAGTIAQADNLGIFGSQGVFAAALWPLNGNDTYILAGFRAFRGFDGATASFGDTSVQSTSTSVQDVVVYASHDSTTPGRVVFVAINRSSLAKVTAINGQPLSGTAYLYQMTAASAENQNPVAPVAVGQVSVAGSSFTIALPPLSVTTIDVH